SFLYKMHHIFNQKFIKHPSI
ncbi:hypothetical protein, partial [Plasmodium yoelii yoelii]